MRLDAFTLTVADAIAVSAEYRRRACVHAHTGRRHRGTTMRGACGGGVIPSHLPVTAKALNFGGCGGQSPLRLRLCLFVTEAARLNKLRPSRERVVSIPMALP